MGKSVKYHSYEDWVVARLTHCRSKTLGTDSPLKLPKYLFDLEVEPNERDLERRQAMRDCGTLSVSSRRWNAICIVQALDTARPVCATENASAKNRS